MAAANSRRNGITVLAAIIFLFTTVLTALKFHQRALYSSNVSVIIDEKSVGIPLDAVSASRKAQTIGYAISLIKCGDKQSTPEGLTDAALVLRHSIHQNSVRNPASGSKYDYQMYALVHSQAEQCSDILKQVGFQVLVVDPPLNVSDIKGDYLRKHIQKEWCCGADEFIKLHAYSLPEEVVVHVDIDFAFLQPMDELFDSMLFDKHSVKGQAARRRIPLERHNDTLPDRIDAFITRDWPQTRPGRKPGFQAGFIVLRTNHTIINEVVDIVLEGNYTEGYGHDAGWHSSGHGIYVGAMAMQGLMAYYYDYVSPHSVVELNQCRYNWMGMDTRYRAPPNFAPGSDRVGMCRNDGDYCEDCMNTSLNLIKSVHYTVCRKPWNCISKGHPYGKDPITNKPSGAIDTKTCSLEQCLKVVQKWHEYRRDLEHKLHELTHDETVLAKGDYKKDVFMGHCTQEGAKGYVQIAATPESFDRLHELYENE